MHFPIYRQQDSMLCGITCLQMICRYYGIYLKPNYFQRKCQEGREGISLSTLKYGAEALGFSNDKKITWYFFLSLHETI